MEVKRFTSVFFKHFVHWFFCIDMSRSAGAAVGGIYKKFLSYVSLELLHALGTSVVSFMSG